MRAPVSSAGRLRLRATLHGAVVALFVAASLVQLAGMTPEAGVAHVRCSEHGELTHAATSTVDAVMAARRSQTAPEAPVLSARPAPSSGAHEHCPYGAILDQPAPTLSPSARLDSVKLVPAARTIDPTRGRLQPRRLVLDCAPKTSPPLG